MKKLLLIGLTGISALALMTACTNGIPECKNADMDKCGFGTVYSEERTAVHVPKDEKRADPAPIVSSPAKEEIAEPVTIPEPVAIEEPDDRNIMATAKEPSQDK